MNRLLALAIALGTATLAVAAEPCQPQPTSPPPDRRIGEWIGQDDWLIPGNLRVAQTAVGNVMPAVLIAPATSNAPLAAGTALDLQQLAVTDPADGARRSAAFILDHRLDADALVVIRRGKLVAERYRAGVAPNNPRLLLSATRPILSILAASAIAKGRLAADKAVSRPLTTNSEGGPVGLRKLSVRRLLEGETSFEWSAAQLTSWKQAAGWSAGGEKPLREWLARPETWDTTVTRRAGTTALGLPEDDLLAWVVSAAENAPLSRLLCETLLAPMRGEHPALWLTDTGGHELAAGMALTPRDFALLGQLLLDSRTAGKRAGIPDWLVAALVARAADRADPSLRGLPEGSEYRYGFVRIGGRGNRVAIIGPYGTSLFIDFDRRTVIGLFASHPVAGSPLLFATLYQFWNAVSPSGNAEVKPR